MLVKLNSSALHGVEAYPITVEVSVSGKGMGYLITGLPDDAVKESLGRISEAVNSAGYFFPRARLVINLAHVAEAIHFRSLDKQLVIEHARKNHHFKIIKYAFLFFTHKTK